MIQALTNATRSKAGGNPVSRRDNGSGFTLIEAMVSLLILAVIFLGLQAGMMMAITRNTENLLRNEAVSLAKERMDRYRINPGTPPNSETFSRQVRNYQVTYFINNSDYDNDDSVLRMVVSWSFQNEQHTLEYTSHI